MLEVKNIFKSYKPKKGPEVKALNGVSIKFPEKGLVFILGKSGSGKSTLLNVLGGLDVIDEGEIIIKGKSSKDFTQADFDSYRNTYLGFVFQEYNILDEFSVGENIALALELQGKKATDEILQNILKGVDLEGFSNRKPNELSGGQKQRVAIARALIKNPEIILADEPTGALDSNTGLQVFDTLKKLANDKLVIVVSHDREFAEMYGDRVIELKDGQVISDIEKFREKPNVEDSGLIKVDEHILAFKKGHILDEKDIEIINNVLKESDTLITSDELSNKEFKRIARIDDNLNREIFKATDENAIKYKDSSEFSLIKSSLPIKNSFKIGVSALKNKPIRLFFTILLSVCSFGLFGIADSMGSFDEATTVYDSLKDSDNRNYQIQQYEGVKTKDDTINKVRDYFTKEDKVEFENKYGLKSDGVFDFTYNSEFFYIDREKLNYLDGDMKFVYVDENRLNELGYELVAGHLPIDEYEIALTDLHLYNMKLAGLISYDDESNKVEISNSDIKSYGDILDKIVAIDGEFYKICGFIDTHTMSKENNKWEELYIADSLHADARISNLADTFRFEVLNNYPNMIYVSKSKEDSYFNGDGFLGDQQKGGGLNLSLHPQQINQDFLSLNLFANFDSLSTDYYFIDPNKTTLNSDEILLSENMKTNYLELDKTLSVKEIDKVRTMVTFSFDKEKNEWKRVEDYKEFENVSDLENNGLKYFIYDYALKNLPTSEIFDKFAKEFYKVETDNGFIDLNIELTNEMKVFAYYSLILENSIILSDKFSEDVHDFVLDNYSQSTNGFNGKNSYILEIEFKDYLLNNYSNYKNLKFTLSLNTYDYISGKDQEYSFGDLKIVGFVKDPTYKLMKSIVLPNIIFGKIKQFVNFTYDVLLTNVDNNNTLFDLIKQNDFYDEGRSYYLINVVSSSIGSFVALMKILAMIFIYIGLALAIFSGILLANFISSSIAYKKKEIGILRAVGAKSSDVFKIFFSEALVIAMVNFLLACIAAIISIYFINDAFISTLHNLGTFYFFGIRQFGILLALSIGVALLATFLPVFFLSRKKPVDTINNR